jgi:hypothetical protein
MGINEPKWIFPARQNEKPQDCEAGLRSMSEDHEDCVGVGNNSGRQ